MQLLPLGTSDFSTLRARDQIYVDKTDLIYELARLPEKFFLSRPRRFGKSLLVSTFDSLFRYGLTDFSGLKIEKYWTDKTYQVVRLDFSRIKLDNSTANFSKKRDLYLALQFKDIGFSYDINDFQPLLNQLDAFLQKLPQSSLVILIDEYDAPLTEAINDKELFEHVHSKLADFYSILKTNDSVIRFMFITGITKFNKLSIFSELNNFSDISLSPRFGNILGYTREETEAYFEDYLRVAEKVHKFSRHEMMQELLKNYDGFCFDEFAQNHVFAPWSILKFLSYPEIGFKNYWFESGGKPSVLRQYMKSHILRRPESYSNEKSIRISELSGTSTVDGLSDIGLLTQAGYLTIKGVRGGRLFVDYPNEEVRSSMAQIYTEKLLSGADLVEIHADGITKELTTGNVEQNLRAFPLLGVERR